MAYTTSFRALLTAGLMAVAIIAATLAGSTAAATKAPVRVTFVGDSVPASIMYSPRGEVDPRPWPRDAARPARLPPARDRELLLSGRGSDKRAPVGAVAGDALGDVLIVDVGYNESAFGYRAGIDRVMRAARAQGASGVVWVLLRETRDIYRETNAVIRSAQKRWPQLLVADWNAYSRDKPWFSSDGLHTGSDRSRRARRVPPPVRLPRRGPVARRRTAPVLIEGDFDGTTHPLGNRIHRR